MGDEQIGQPARLRAAAYAQQPSVWPAPTPTPPKPKQTHRLARIVRTGVAAGVLLAGPPWLLWQVSGNPITVLSSWWGSAGLLTADSPPPQAAGLRVGLIWACWLGWAVLATLLVGSLAGVLRGRRLPRWRLPMPLHRLVFGLTGTATAALVTTPVTAAVASPPAHVAPAPGLAPSASVGQLRDATTPTPGNADTTEPGHAKADSDLATIVVADARYDHPVRKGDTLSKVARVWLGDPDRWPDICQLNKHRHFPDGRTLTDCDLIYPGWELRLPADAVAPPIATPTRPPGTPARPAELSERPQPEHSEPPVTSTTPASQTPAAQQTPSAAAGPDDAQSDHQDTGDDLVLPAGSIIPWTLAAAITATAALVWLQRRRRYLPGTGDDPQDLPAPVLAAQHHTRHTTPPAPAPAPAEPAHTQRLPSGGVGLIGSGADAAARGMIITALTTGAPTEPDQRAEVIIDQHTLTALVGNTPITGWQRLHITDTLDQALTLLDTHLLHRARILDEHNLTDLDTLRDTAPNEEALPRLLLITDAEQATSSMRARVTFGLTHDLDVTTVVLGHWPHGPTISVTDNGDARPEPGSPDADTTRLAVLDVTTTRELLATVREAHTGEPPPATAPTPAPPTATIEGTTAGLAGPTVVDGPVVEQIDDRVAVLDTGEPPNPVLRPPVAPQPPPNEPAPQPPATSDPAGDRPSDPSLAMPPPAAANQPRVKVHLRVLGFPRVEDIVLPGRDLRRRAAELGVFLACYPDGADTATVAEHLVPEHRRRQALQLVHTNASNLRHVLGRAGGFVTAGYVLKHGGSERYRLDPTTVRVDLWQLRDLLTRAELTSAPARTELLREACDLYTAPLADGCDYEWVEPHREKARQQGTEAHLLLADDLIESDPQAASDLLDKAIGLDRYNEELYRKAIHARHSLRDADGIRVLLRALTKALADLDAEPAETTLELAAKLRTNLEQQ